MTLESNAQLLIGRILLRRAGECRRPWLWRCGLVVSAHPHFKHDTTVKVLTHFGNCEYWLIKNDDLNECMQRSPVFSEQLGFFTLI